MGKGSRDKVWVVWEDMGLVGVLLAWIAGGEGNLRYRERFCFGDACG